MKKKNFLWITLSFMMGSAFGITLLSLVSFTGPSSPTPPSPTISPINAVTAKAYYQRYINSATVYNQKLGGFAIDKEIFTALGKLLTDVPTLTGYRVYLGKDNANAPVVMLIATTDAQGTENGASIYSVTMGTHVGPCPPICDSHSPISGQ